jgi:hypothetical protein
VCKTIARVLDFQRFGGTLVRRDDTTVLLVDYDFVSQSALDAICTQHPGVQVFVRKCESSTSGYMLAFESVNSSYWLVSARFINGVICVLMSLMSAVVACGNVRIYG